MPIPPDPDGENEQRAEWARSTLEHFMDLTGCDPEDALTDLLGNMGHLHDRDPAFGTLADAMRRAVMHYEAETDGQGKALPRDDDMPNLLREDQA